METSTVSATWVMQMEIRMATETHSLITMATQMDFSTKETRMATRTEMSKLFDIRDKYEVEINAEMNPALTGNHFFQQLLEQRKWKRKWNSQLRKQERQQEWKRQCIWWGQW